MATLPIPSLETDAVYVALDADVYPIESGSAIAISGRDPVLLEDWDSAFVESQVPRSNALYCHLRDGTPYLCGPLARLYHHSDRLHPVAARALEATQVRLPIRNPYESIVARCVEMVHALAEGLDLVDGYLSAPIPFRQPRLRDAVGYGATEAPRGLLWHRYEVDEAGRVRAARIVPPTSQNQARIERDLMTLAPSVLTDDLQTARLRCEQLVRAYDPCISCATHFLELEIVRADDRCERAS